VSATRASMQRFARRVLPSKQCGLVPISLRRIGPRLTKAARRRRDERPFDEVAHMRVAEIMTQAVQICRPEDTLEDVAQLLWDHDCGCLPVVSGNGAMRVVGLITDRDVCMCALFHKKPLADLDASEAMSKQVFACRPSNAVSVAEKLMGGARIRRLPVLDEEDRLVGMLSLADLACNAAQQARQPRPPLTETEVGDTLAAICQPPANSAGRHRSR
jgi:CBS domain-containing protein